MRILFTLFISFTSLVALAQSPSFKAKMQDPTYNINDVISEAEAYFQTIDKFAKGSGYKGFQRWRHANEYKYYPSGDRSQADPFFAEHQFQEFLLNQGNSSSGLRLFNSGWKDLGPYTIDSITGHYAAGLGRVEDFWVSPTNANLIYQGSRSGGFWKTTDGGTSWTGTVTDSLFASGVNAITASPTNPDSILINVRNAQNGYSHGLYRSTNGGTSFSLSNFNPANVGFGGLGSNFVIYAVEYHPRVSNLVFVGTSQGVYRSDNNLSTWTRLINSGDIKEIAFHPTNDSIVYIYDAYYWGSNKNVVLRSTDQGLSYTQSNLIAGNNDNTTVELVTTPQCANCLYFGSSNGVWRSTDNGLNFTFLANPNESCHGFAVSDTDSSKMIYGYVDMEASSDGGNNWTRVTRWSLGNTNGAGSGNWTSYQTSTDYVHADMRNAKAVNGVFYVATDGFLSKSTDNGISWTNIGEGVGIRENYALGLSQSNHFRTMSGSQDNGTSIHTEKGWVEFYGADGMAALIHPLNADWMIGSLQYGGRRRTMDGGLTQSGVTPSGSNSAYWVAPITYDPNDHMVIYDFRDSVYRSTDFADNYVTLGVPSTFSNDIQRAEIAENNSDIIVISRSEDIEKSTNGGVSFSSIKNGLPNHSIQDIAFDPLDDDVMIVVYARYQIDNEKVFLTTDGGSSWTNITYNLGDMPIRSVVIDHSDSSYIYLGGEIGVYVKSMNGGAWSLYNQGLPNTSIRDLEINYGSNTLRAATWGRGLWEYSLMGRLDYPAITYTTISNPPTMTMPKETMDQYVTSQIHYVGTLSSVYVDWSLNAPTFGNTISMTNTMDSTWVSDSPLPDGPVGTKVFFKVMAVGSNGDTTETYKFMYTIREFAYCAATGTSSAGNLYLSDVSVANLNNSSNNDAYTLYTSPVVSMFVDSTYTLDLNANTNWSSNDYGAWIDYNKDAEFSPSEQILLDNNSGNNANATFTVPSNAVIYDTLVMRVRLSYYGNDPLTCDDQFGEVEDYLVVLRRAPQFDLLLNADSVCAGDLVTFSYQSNDIDTLEWHFSNGSQTITSSLVSDSAVFNDPGVYDLLLTTYIGTDTFALDCLGAVLVSPNYTLTSHDTICEGNNYTFPDGSVINNVTSSTSHLSSLTTVAGCDSLVTTQLFVKQASQATDVQSACDSYTWIDGNTYTASNNSATHTLTNAQGCDSVVTLDLTISNSSTGTDVISACDTYTWIDGNTYTASNNSATHTLTNAQGCDSVVTLDLTINSVSASVSQSGIVLTANPQGAAYQWYDCNANASISGATSQSFTPTASGSYAVIITQNNCTDTSSCINVTITGMEGTQPVHVSMYPNPNTGQFNLEFPETNSELDISIFDGRGKLVTKVSQENRKTIPFDLDLAKGKYFVFIQGENIFEVVSFVVSQ